MVSQADVLEGRDEEAKKQYLQEIIEANPELTDLVVLGPDKQPSAYAKQNGMGSNWSSIPQSLQEVETWPDGALNWKDGSP